MNTVNGQIINLLSLTNIYTYEHISEGENEGKYSIKADGKEILIGNYAGNGWTTSWQENTLEKVRNQCVNLLGEDKFTLPYYVNGDGYVFREKGIVKI